MSIVNDIWRLKIEHHEHCKCATPYSLSLEVSTRGVAACTCGAYEHNARVDAIVAKLAEMLMYQSLTYAAYGIEQDTDNPFVTTVTTEVTNDQI